MCVSKRGDGFVLVTHTHTHLHYKGVVNVCVRRGALSDCVHVWVCVCVCVTHNFPSNGFCANARDRVCCDDHAHDNILVQPARGCVSEV